MSKKKLSHIDSSGKANMVNIGAKPETERTACASACVCISAELFSILKNNSLTKGDALATARIAGIQAAKRTDELIPLCHPLPLTHVSVKLELIENPCSVKIHTEARTTYKTGVEMEALTAASVAALTIYDMGKSVDKGIVVEFIRLEKKTGGKSGTWQREK